MPARCALDTACYTFSVSSNAFRIGGWLVEPSLKRLSRDDQVIEIEPKAMAVLVFLAETAGEVVSNDQIIAAVWENRPMGDNPVYKVIARLRQVLGDDAQQPRYIATVTKMGYRLVAEVLPAGEVETAAADDARIAKRGHSRPVVWAIVAGFVIGLMLTASISLKRAISPTGDQQNLSTFPGSHSDAHFSPDSTQVAFVNTVGGNAHIWRLDMLSHATQQLTFGEIGDGRPRWSADGSTIYFSRSGAIWSVPESGGEEVQIIQNGFNADISADGRRLAFERRGEIWIADASGANQQRVNGVPDTDLTVVPRQPALSPDGKTIAFFHGISGPLGEIWSVPASGGQASRLTFDETFAGSPAFTPDGQTILFMSQRRGSQTLWQIPATGGTPAPVLTGPGEYAAPSVSPDGKLFVYTNTRTRYLLTRTNPVSGESVVLRESSGALVAPTLSPDYRQVAYFEIVAGGSAQIFTMPVAGGPVLQVTEEPGTVNIVPQWSADGNTIYFYRVVPSMSFRKVDANGGPSTEVVAGWDWDKENGARVDPTESVIAYSRLNREVPVATMLRNMETGQETAYGGILEWPRWSRDGAVLIGADFRDKQTPFRGDIAICTTPFADCLTLAEAAHIPVFSADESLVYFVRPTRAGQTLWNVPADGGGPATKIMDMEPVWPPGVFYDVVDDGSVIWVQYLKDDSELWLTEFQ